MVSSLTVSVLFLLLLLPLLLVVLLMMLMLLLLFVKPPPNVFDRDVLPNFASSPIILQVVK